MTKRKKPMISLSFSAFRKSPRAYQKVHVFIGFFAVSDAYGAKRTPKSACFHWLFGRILPESQKPMFSLAFSLILVAEFPAPLKAIRYSEFPSEFPFAIANSLANPNSL